MVEETVLNAATATANTGSDFRLKDETCERWEERNEICDVKHSPEVV